MYKKFKVKGKTTIYALGLITAIWGFLPILAISILDLVGKFVVEKDLAWGVVVLLVIMGGGVFIPQQSLQSKKEKYAFPNNGYFDKFLK